MRIPFTGCTVLAGLCLLAGSVLADTATLMGARGVNRVPDARHDPAGTLRLQLGTQDPYAHTSIGFQATDFVGIVLRQSAQTSSLLRQPDRLFPGLDLKIRLRDETGVTPAFSLGLISALGHERLASEYLVASKRWGPIDASAGIGWGRMGEAGTFRNPLTVLGAHFDRPRRFGSNNPADPGDWFTGSHVGLFGGVVIDTGLAGVRIAADWGSDRHRVERLDIQGFNTPKPWSVAAHALLSERWQGSVGVVGGDAVMARLALIDIAGNTPPSSQTASALSSSTLSLSPLGFLPTFLPARPLLPFRMQTPHHDIVMPRYLGLRGPDFILPRAGRLTTPDEQWSQARMIPAADHRDTQGVPIHTDVTLRSDLSIMEEEASVLSRHQAIVQTRLGLPLGLMLGAAVGINAADDLNELARVRRAYLPMRGRSTARDFAARTATPTRLYAGWLHSIQPNWHVAMTGGYLEEMVAGVGGEILYRPPDHALALGVAAYRGALRDPASPYAADLDERIFSTGSVTLYYALPQQETTLRLAFHRYLAGDQGVEFGLTHNFPSRLVVDGTIRLSNLRDPDPFGGEQGDVYGLTLRLPLGRPHRVAPNTYFEGSVMPLARRAAQVIDAPLPLYSLTTPLMPNATMQGWFEDPS